MRLSDIKGERTLEVIAEIIDPIANIAEDEQAAELFTRRPLPEGMTPNQYLLARARRAVPALLRGHKRDIIALLAAIGGTTPEAYEKALDMPRLFKDCVELLTDEAFMAFFTSAASGAEG